MSDRNLNKYLPKAHSDNNPLMFALVIPALNEEKAIGQTLENVLAVRETLINRTEIDEMCIVFVNDGSTDNTQSIAEKYSDVKKIHLHKNRGYGYAIQQGFLETDAQIVGFMDADGTCNAASFVELINHLLTTESDLVLGSRISPESKMPWLRKLGNAIFSRLIGWVSGLELSDPASGIRVIRRDSLNRMMPLPSGLHFTPAMSAIAVLDPRLKITEIPVPYCERVGKSKLSVIKDGIKFVWSILFASLCYNPLRLATFFSLLAILAGIGIGAVLLSTPLDFLTTGLVTGIFIFLALLALASGALAHQINSLLMDAREIPGVLPGLLRCLTDGKRMVAAGIVLCLSSAFSGSIALLTSSFNKVVWFLILVFLMLGGWIFFEGILFRIIWAVRLKREAEQNDPFKRKDPVESE